MWVRRHDDSLVPGCSRGNLLAGSFTAILILMTSGCSDQIRIPSTVPVSGQVLQKGKPVPGVTVLFHPQFAVGPVEFIPSGETGPDGKFTLSTGAAGNGAPPGEYLVTLEKRIVVSDRQNSGIETEVDAWKGRYADPASSKWRIEIDSHSHPLPPFEID